MVINNIKVLITGAASGIGREMAKTFAGLGARLFLIDINKKGLDETSAIINKIGGEVLKTGVTNITSYKDMKSFAGEIHSEYGPLDILINNAGIATYALVEDMTHELWEKTIDVNLKGTINGIECFLPEMIKAKRGHVVSVASAAGLFGVAWQAAYSASKWGVVGLMEVLRYDLRQHGIGVTVVCPGYVRTPLFDTVAMPGLDNKKQTSDELKAGFIKMSTTPESIARLTVRAIHNNKFMVIAPFSNRVLYFFKRKFPPVYHLAMIIFSNRLNRAKK